MRYIRTKNNQIVDLDTMEFDWALPRENFVKSNAIKQADTIEELCDEFVVVQKDFHDLLNADTHCLRTLKRYYGINKIEVLGIYGAIWTDKGLIYVAKMNNEGELELL